VAGLLRGVRPIGDWSTLMTLFEMLDAPMAVAPALHARGKACGNGGVQRIVDQRGFARAGHAGHAGQQADRKLDASRLCRRL
jgi:hypothetical protein